MNEGPLFVGHKHTKAVDNEAMQSIIIIYKWPVTEKTFCLNNSF